VTVVRFNLTPNTDTTRYWMRFYATMGQTDKAVELRKNLVEAVRNVWELTGWVFF